MVVDISEYKVGVVVALEELKSTGSSNGKPLRLCSVNVGTTTSTTSNNEDGQPVDIVTSAPNVRLESRVVVALAGSTVVTETGEELTLKPTTVGGKVSHGMLCDSKMLGWTGGAAGVAVNLPPEYDVGSAPPSQKPRPNAGGSAEGGDAPVEDTPVTGGLFERKLSEFNQVQQ